MKKRLMKLLAQKETRKAELGTKAAATEDVKELRSINTEIDGVNTEITELRSMIEAMPDDVAPKADETLEARGASDPIGVQAVVATYGAAPAQEARGTADKVTVSKYEQRGEDLKARKTVVVSFDETPEERSVNLAGGTLVNPKNYADGISGKFNEVSGLIDVVNTIPLQGGESYVKAFEVSGSEGDYSTETGAYTSGDPVVDYVEIGKAKITAYTELTDEAAKLPSLNYQGLVIKNIRNALRKKITKMIATGAGGANAITGIFNAPTKVIPTASDLEFSAIDADTLDAIVFGYGGDEAIEGAATLILSKADLAAFNAVRLTDGKKAYKITLAADGNSGTISSDESFAVPFILNSVCPALSASGTAADTYCMAFGKLGAYELPVFSAMTIESSTDFKFSTGQIAYRGAVWVGGNVAAYKGFVRIKKIAAT